MIAFAGSHDRHTPFNFYTYRYVRSLGLSISSCGHRGTQESLIYHENDRNQGVFGLREKNFRGGFISLDYTDRSVYTLSIGPAAVMVGEPI